MQASDIRVFIPSKDFNESIAFYQALGFVMQPAGEDLAIFEGNGCTFFLQKYYSEEFAKNLMLQLLVPSIEDALAVIESVKNFNIKYQPIKDEAWGRVVYLWGPSGELWHVTQLNS
jgi:hypothetical protein